MMNTQKEYIEVAKAKLDKLNARIGSIEAEVARQKAGAAEGYHKHLADLKARRDEMKRDLERLKSASGDAWEQVKDGMEKTFDTFQETYQKVRKQFEKV